MSATPTPLPNLAQIRAHGASAEMGVFLFVHLLICVYLFIYLFIYFQGTHLQVRPVGGFSRLMAQTTRNHARMKLPRE